MSKISRQIRLLAKNSTSSWSCVNFANWASKRQTSPIRDTVGQMSKENTRTNVRRGKKLGTSIYDSFSTFLPSFIVAPMRKMFELAVALSATDNKNKLDSNTTELM